jgi:SAM-dependent methyltransferase
MKLRKIRKIWRKWREDPAVEHELPSSAIKLNLGCGNKILDGFVNVDVVEERAGAKPDIVANVSERLPFPDDYADLILSVHVIEHFYRWEVLEVLREWVRVLKPGGIMVCECPNLLSACEAMLRKPEASAGTGKEVARSMWVLYGDPNWRDPLMCHRWGYTPVSASALLREAGLVDVVQRSAHYKLKEPRDLRVVGMKPPLA